MNISLTSRKLCVPFILCGVLLSSHAALNQTAQAQSTNQRPTPAQTAATSWKAFTPENGRFEVLMPGQPTPRVQSLSTPAGEIKTYFYNVALESGKVNYTVSYVDLPKAATGMPANLLLGAVSGNLAGDDRVKVLDEQTINLGNYPGRELRIESPDKAIVRHRAYLVNGRVYQIAVEVPATQEKTLTSDVERFFNSFKLL